MNRKDVTVGGLLVLLLACATALPAQETTGTVRGRLTDAQGLPVPDASVSAIGAQGARISRTDIEGRFNIPFLTPGQYTVRAEVRGFKPAERTNVDVSVGHKPDLTLRMEVGDVSETVAVTVETRAIDTSTTTIGAVLDPGELASLPVGRTFAQLLQLTPGVSSSGTLGRANPSMSGSTGLENQYLVDGANITNIGYGALGSFSRVFGSLGNATPVDFIKEIQVKTGGYEAEFGQATGGVISIVTKSGTNALGGSGFAYTQPMGLQAAPRRYQSSNGSVNTVGTSVNDAGLEAGFPLVRDRLFFFGAIDPSWRVTTLTAPAGDGFPLNTLGNVDQRRRAMSYVAKGTLQLGSANRVDASFFGDPSHGPVGPQRAAALLVQDTSSFSAVDFGGHQQTVRYSGVSRRNWLVEAAFARALNTVSELPSVDAWRIADRTATPTQISGGIGFYEAGNRSESRQWSAKATRISGPHSIKFGIEYDRAAYAQRNQLTGPTFTAFDGRQTATGGVVSVLSDSTYGQIYRATATFNGERATDQRYLNLFAQDGWRAGSRLTVSAGIRYEQETMSGTIVKSWQLKNNWAPRIGATVDPAGDGRTKVFASYGLSFARLPNDLAVVALSNDESLVRGDYFDANLTRPVPDGILAAGTARHFIVSSSGADAIDPHARLAYTTEAILGIEREILPRTVVGLRYVVRNMPRVVEDVANCPIVAYDLASTASVCGSIQYIVTNPSASIPVNPEAISINPAFSAVRFDDPVHTYKSVELTLNRRGARWSSMASYRWSRLRGNFEGFYRDDNAQSDPGLSSLFDFPTNDPTYTSIGGPVFGYAGDIRLLGDPHGVLPLDRPHQIKVYANYEWATRLNVGVGINLSSGKPLTPMASQPNYGDPGEIPVSARGTGIQTVDGFMTRTPFERQVDLQASYTRKVSGNRQVIFVADIFNLFNERRVTSYDQNTQLTYPTPNPDFGKPISTLFPGNPPQFQAPFAARAGVRFQF